MIPEPFGQVVIEGMAAGRAVVAADGGGPAEVITDGVDGLLFPPGDSADAWRQCLAGSQMTPRSRATRTGRPNRAADFTPRVIAGDILSAYRWLLETRPARRFTFAGSSRLL